MIETYRAILRGDRLEWRGDAPDETQTKQGVEVFVTIRTSKGTSDGKAMANALEKIAASGSLAEISDPSAWQREQRRDRPLPGRDA